MFISLTKGVILVGNLKLQSDCHLTPDMTNPYYFLLDYDTHESFDAYTYQKSL